MTSTNDVKWTLWVFAGPGALARGSRGELLPLADVVGELPAGVGLLAETVGAPTLLQQLTGEWPTERLSRGLDIEEVPLAERDLESFLAWADAQTPRGSKRALIVLGDVLQAIGEAPKDLVAGDYRPPFPATIQIKKDPNSNGVYQNSETFYIVDPNDTTITYPSYHPKKTNDASYKLSGSSNSWQYFSNLTDGLAGLKLLNLDGGSTWYQKSSSGNWFSKGTFNSDKTFTTDSSGSTYVIPITTQTDGTKGYSINTRSIDDAGSADVDLGARRIDALVAALDGRHIDLLAGDGRELSQLGALRRLTLLTNVILHAGQHPSPGQPLMALLEVLRNQAEVTPERLVEQTVVKASQGTDLVALRSSSTKPLVAALEDFASKAIAGSPARRCFEEAWNRGNGGDLAALTKRLKAVDHDQATRIETCATATVIAPSPAADGSSFGIDLDGPGLQLDPPSPWIYLLDAVNGHADADVVRRTLEDLRALRTSTRRAGRLAPTQPTQAVCVLEYRGPDRTNEALAPEQDFERFASRELGTCDARHVALVIRGQWVSAHSGSVTFDDGAFLPVAALARSVRDALSHRRHGPLALIVFEDPELLRIEIADELRDVAYVLMTAVAGAEQPASPSLTQRMREVIGRCEERAADALGKTATDPIAPLLHGWRRDVAVRLAKLLVAPDPDETRAVTLQGIDLRHISAICRLFDRLCHQMFEHLDDALVLAAAQAGDGARSLIEWINKMQMDGFHPRLEASGWKDELAARLYDDWGELYNWLSQSASARREGGAPLWLAPDFTEDRSADGHCSRLRISVGSQQPKDYRALSFHRSVSLHALLTAARLLGSGEARRQWGLIKLGLAYGPQPERHWQLQQLIQEPGAAHYFRILGAPPLMTLAIDRSDTGYDLRLATSESQAAVVRQHEVVDFQVVERSLEGLAFVMSRSMASRDGLEYLAGLGASFSEDVFQDLRGELERERARILQSGGCREAHLALQLPRELMHYPWELIQLPVKASRKGLAMLADHFTVGRQMWTDRDTSRTRRHDHIRVLIVANPITSLGSDLPAARLEGQEVQKLCEEMTRELRGVVEFECDVSIGETLTRTVLRQRLRNGDYDVLHFAGHGKYDANDPDHSGWALSDGLLTVTELSNTLSSCESPPWLIYANACSAGMIGDTAPSQYHGDVHGMAEACIRAGVSAYVAPLWRIHDDSARMLARELHRRLLLERSTIGVALQLARIQVRKTWEARRGDSGLGDVSWAGMVLFGNPGVRLRETAG